MLEFSASNIERMSVHHVGNKTNEEHLHLSKTNADIKDIRLRNLLKQYFLTPFAEVEFQNFTFSNGDFNLNPLFKFAAEMFDKSRSLQKVSVDIAKHLYEASIHPQIKPGDLFVAYITNITIDSDQQDAIGIFKAENRQPFLKLNKDESEFSLDFEDGINIDKLDKGCLILNTDRKKGFKVCTLDKSNKSVDAQYWKYNFLNVKPCSDDYHFTKDFLTVTKNFVTKQMTDEFDMNKTDQIDLLNRSVDYFKNNHTFEKSDFENEVLQQSEVISSFRNYGAEYSDAHELEVSDNFEISSQAVKKQARIFKSVLKLDKNFHIYIHGDRKLIEQGTDADGRKYYKIYYDSEN